MNVRKAQQLVATALRQGAELRLEIADRCGSQIVDAAVLIQASLDAGGKLLLFGNGGSAADAQHIAAEFVGRFMAERRALPAIALTTDSSILTAVGNDYGFDQVFARQIAAIGNDGDVAIGISTSGNSPNVLAGIRRARLQKMKTIGLAGRDGSALMNLADIPIAVDSDSTARIQECHITIGHLLCELVERDLVERSVPKRKAKER